jgi:hypothetical protein
MIYLCLAAVLILGQAAPQSEKIQLWISIITLATILAKAWSDSLARKSTEQKLEENTEITKAQRKDIRHDVRGELNGAITTQLNTAAELAKTVEERERKLLEEIASLRRTAEAAFREANNFNRKLTEMQVERAARPQPVEVVNSPDNPVPVQDKH